MNGRILWIEIRRNELLFIFPVVMFLYGFGTWESVRSVSVVLWAENSVEARNSIALLGPFAGVVAAWMAGRDRRRGLDDLIATTPRPALSRDLTVMAATALLGIAAYTVVAAVILGRTSLRASWDGPYLSVLVPGFCTIVAMAAIGYPIGRAVPRRVTAILVGAGLIILIALPIAIWDSWLGYLSPAFATDAPLSPWWGIRPDIALPQSIFQLGVAFLGLAGIAAVGRARRQALPLLLVAIVTTAIGVGTIRSGVLAAGEPEIADYEPVCAGEAVVVCVHPAYEGALDELVAGTEVIVTPFVGIEGVPTRFEQMVPDVDADTGDLFVRDGARIPQDRFYIDEPVDEIHILGALSQIASGLLAAPDTAVPPTSSAWHARLVVELWLLESAGFRLTCEGNAAEYSVDGLLGSSGFGFAPAPCDEAAHFSALDPDVRLDWLRRHYAELRAGEIELEDLP